MPGLKAMHAAEQQLSPSCSTNKKRPLPKTPTGATPKSKRPLFFTPSKRPSSSLGKPALNKLPIKAHKQYTRSLTFM
ncbi:hypothetical protein DPMN_168750 [Dreissena polymorpha]|uniref:Uncharacterized protein n=1 Tax=Dreissena polymorpha TaxID=45954 RepID=A0A9D4IZX7_DREPO|nr:hypothetical protein DPMN_168750 [Dreissena polymorpha]